MSRRRTGPAKPRTKEKRLVRAAAGAVAAGVIERRIYLIRGQKVMVDADLAGLYRVSTGNLNLAVRRNKDRFPEDFLFHLTREEYEDLRLQNAISSWGGRRYLPDVSPNMGSPCSPRF